jgi:hypothetical protein
VNELFVVAAAAARELGQKFCELIWISNWLRPVADAEVAAGVAWIHQRQDGQVL